MWEVSTGRFLGSVSVSAASEYVVLSYVVNVFFIPRTQASATERLAEEIVQKLAGAATDGTAAGPPASPASGP